MKAQKMGIKVLILVVVAGFSFQLTARDDEVTTTESVRVVNVEVPVRVFIKGSPVDGLEKNNFKVFEDGKPQMINGFYIRKKKLSGSESPNEALENETVTRSRYFVLVFKITSYNTQLHKGLEYLLTNVIRKSDQCLVFINDRSIFFKNLAHVEHVRAVLQKFLREESHQARQRLETYLKKVEEELRTFRIRTQSSNVDFGVEILRFLQRYHLIWKEYSHNFLQPSVDNFYYFSRHLEKVKKEKWVINFYQIEMFPKLKQTGHAMEEIKEWLGMVETSGQPEQSVCSKAISSLLYNIDLELHTSKDFPADEISKLFFKVDATFHSVLIPMNRGLLSADFEFKGVSTEIESSLREIAKRTGGSLRKTGDLETALDNLQKKEDITYMLTYSPDNPDRVGRIRVETDNKKFKILYDDQMRADYIREYLRRKKLEVPDIRVLNTHFRDKTLTIDVKDFLMVSQVDHIRKGRVYMEVEVLNSSQKVLYDQKKTIIADEDHISVKVDFPWLGRGRYNIIVQATDIQTGKTSSDFIQPVIH